MRRSWARQRMRDAEFQRRCSRILKSIVRDLLKPAKPPPIRFDITPLRRKRVAMRLRIVRAWERFARDARGRRCALFGSPPLVHRYLGGGRARPHRPAAPSVRLGRALTNSGAASGRALVERKPNEL